jgi:hypothetical protein
MVGVGGWRGGVADYWGTKNDKRRRRKSCLWTGLIHRGKEGKKSGYKKMKRGIRPSPQARFFCTLFVFLS